MPGRLWASSKPATASSASSRMKCDSAELPAWARRTGVRRYSGRGRRHVSRRPRVEARGPADSPFTRFGVLRSKSWAHLVSLNRTGQLQARRVRIHRRRGSACSGVCSSVSPAVRRRGW